MTTPATPRPWEYTVYGEDEAVLRVVRAVNAHDALLAALRALVEDNVLGRPPTQWCNVCEVSNGHTMDCSAGVAVALLRDLSPEEKHEHQWITAALYIGKGEERYQHYCSVCHAMRPKEEGQ